MIDKATLTHHFMLEGHSKIHFNHSIFQSMQFKQPNQDNLLCGIKEGEEYRERTVCKVSEMACKLVSLKQTQVHTQ